MSPEWNTALGRARESEKETQAYKAARKLNDQWNKMEWKQMQLNWTELKWNGMNDEKKFQPQQMHKLHFRFTKLTHTTTESE